MRNKEIIDRLERIRDFYLKALDNARVDLPKSSASMELMATRLTNNTILDLEDEERITKNAKAKQHENTRQIPITEHRV